MAEESKIEKKKVSLKFLGDWLSYRWILNNITFFIFLSALAVLYIANGHMADNSIRKINDIGRQLKDLQYEYKTLKGDMMFRSRESEMVKAAEPLGLTMDTTPPVRIKLIKRSHEVVE